MSFQDQSCDDDYVQFIRQQNERMERTLADHADLMSRSRGAPRPYIDDLRRMQEMTTRSLANHRRFMEENPPPPPMAPRRRIEQYVPDRPRQFTGYTYDTTNLQERMRSNLEPAMRHEIGDLTKRAQRNLAAHRELMERNPAPVRVGRLIDYDREPEERNPMRHVTPRSAERTRNRPPRREPRVGRLIDYDCGEDV